MLDTHTRLFDPAVSRRRNLHKLVPELKRRQMWKEARVGRLPIVLLDAADVVTVTKVMSEQGQYCYE